MLTRVWAISGDSPVTMTVAPRSRAASTVCTRWLATLASSAATPVTSMTTTLARFARMPRRSCSVSWRARCGSISPIIGRMSRRSRTCKHRSRQKPDRLLLLANDALALLDEADGHGDRDAVGGGLVGVEHAVQHAHVAVVLGEQRPREHVAEQEHDPHDLVRLDAPGNDALGEIAGIGLERFHRPRLQRLHVAVVDGRGLGEDLLAAHRRQELWRR